MKSLKYSFDQTRKWNPYYSDYVCFAETVRYRKFNKRTIRYWFDKLVDPWEYDAKEKEGLVNHMVFLTNKPRITRGEQNLPKTA